MAQRIIERLTVILCYLIFLCTFPFTILFCLKSVPEYTRAIVFRFGRLKKKNPFGPGLIFILPCIDNVVLIDLRVFTIDIYPQEILSKDQVTVQVDAVIYYFIFNAIDAVTKVNDYCYSTSLLGATILRNVLGTKELAKILMERKAIAEAIQTDLDKATVEWGVKVERVEIKSVKLPFKLQRAMAAEAEASREARAKVISADGELQASKMLKQASDIMTESTVAVQLRYMQTLNAISTQKRSTIIFPIPIDIIPKKNKI